MRFDVLTLFPEIFTGYLSQSLLNLAIERELVRIDLHNIRCPSIHFEIARFREDAAPL